MSSWLRARSAVSPLARPRLRMWKPSYAAVLWHGDHDPQRPSTRTTFSMRADRRHRAPSDACTASSAAVLWHDGRDTRRPSKRARVSYLDVAAGSACGVHQRPIYKCASAHRPCAREWPGLVQLKAFAVRDFFAILLVRLIKNTETRETLCLANHAGQFVLMYAAAAATGHKGKADALKRAQAMEMLAPWATARSWCACGEVGCRHECPQWKEWVQVVSTPDLQWASGWALVELGRTRGAAAAHLKEVRGDDLRRIARALNCSDDRRCVESAVERRQRVIYGDDGSDYMMYTPQNFITGHVPRYETRIRSCVRLVQSAQSARPGPGAGQLTWNCKISSENIPFTALSDRQTRVLYESAIGNRRLCKACLVLFECDVHVDARCCPCRRMVDNTPPNT
jgi:hypothetical protein